MERLIRQVQRNDPRVVHIVLNSEVVPINNEQCESLHDALTKNCFIQRVDLDGRFVDDSLKLMEGEHTALDKLVERAVRMALIQLDVRHLGRVRRLLSTTILQCAIEPSLQALKLHSSTCVDVLDIIRLCPRLEFFSAMNTTIATVAESNDFIDELANKSRLKRLTIMNTRNDFVIFGPERFRAFLLRTSHSLVELELLDLPLTDDHVEALAMTLEQLPCLETIHLRNYSGDVTSQGIHSLVKAVEKALMYGPTALKVLNLRGMPVAGGCSSSSSTTTTDIPRTRNLKKNENQIDWISILSNKNCNLETLIIECSSAQEREEIDVCLKLNMLGWSSRYLREQPSPEYLRDSFLQDYQNRGNVYPRSFRRSLAFFFLREFPNVAFEEYFSY